VGPWQHVVHFLGSACMRRPGMAQLPSLVLSELLQCIPGIDVCVVFSPSCLWVFSTSSQHMLVTLGYTSFRR
jgi:hypothetical protein